MTTVCVTGMHRSGTSFAAHVIHLLGVSLGEPAQLMGGGPDNPAGYWENRDIKELDDEVLAEMGGSWDQPPVLTAGWEHDAALDGLRRDAAVVLEEAFGNDVGNGVAVAWKDPRLSLVLPFWATVTPIATTVLIVRDPGEVAASVGVRNNIEAPQAALLWLRYLLAAMANDPGHLLLRQADFFDDLPGTVRAIASHLGHPDPDDETVAAARAALDPSMRHHVADSIDLPTDPISALAAEVWNSGRVDVGALDPAVAAGVREGWLRPPPDGEELARSRAKIAQLEATLRRRSLTKTRLDARRAALEEPSAEAEVPGASGA